MAVIGNHIQWGIPVTLDATDEFTHVAEPGADSPGLVDVVLQFDGSWSGTVRFDGARKVSGSWVYDPVSATNLNGGATATTRSLEAGALAVVLRPPGFEDQHFAASRKVLIQTVKLMSEVKVVKRFPRSRKEQIQPVRPVLSFDNNIERIQLIAVGASTGGPIALQIILSRLPKNLPVPVLIVQHIATGFVKGFKEWLSATAGIKLKIAEDGESVAGGIGYIAPDNFHMGLSKGNKII